MAKNSSKTSHIHRRFRSAKLLGDLSYTGDVHIPTSIEFMQYNAKQFSAKNIGINEKLKPLIDPEHISWFKVTGIADVNTIYNICVEFGIKIFDIKDLLSSNQVTKVIPYKNNTFVLMPEAVINHSGEMVFNQVAFILGANYIISFQEMQEPIFDDVKEAIKNNRVHIREKGSDYLLYILLNDVHATYNDTLIKLTDKTNEMEDRLINDDTQGIDVMRFIQYKKREHASIKRIISSMREEYINLLHNTNGLIKEDDKMYFNDYDDRLRTLLDDLDILYGSTTSLADLYFNKNNLRMNLVMQKLTVVSTIFIPLTFVVGVWGMNFEYMPELKWIHGYLFAWIVMGVIIVIAIIYLKHKKWF